MAWHRGGVDGPRRRGRNKARAGHVGAGATLGMAGITMLKAAVLSALLGALAPSWGPARAADAGLTLGRLALTPCIAGYGGFCGTLPVPLDRRDPGRGTIEVGFEFYPHTGPGASAGLILAQEGGPGYSTTGSRDGYVRMLGPLRADRDILLVDKRGTGRSAAVDCPTLQLDAEASQADIAACGRQLGADAWHYRTADAADDVAEVVAALGYTRAAFYGDSYGTWFGQVLAALHPDLLSVMVLDSAYPVADDPVDTEVTHGQAAMEIVCRRSPSCAALGGSADARFAALLARLRAEPATGPAPDGNGVPRTVTADPGALFLVVATAGNAPTTWRDLDAAGRALADSGDAAPLLRLVAEARGGFGGGPNVQAFSAGLADAVQCADYPAKFGRASAPPEREAQLDAYVAGLERRDPGTFAPFTLADAFRNPYDVQGYRTCLAWPAPPADAAPPGPLPPGTSLPRIPTLVLAGELDTVTSPAEARATAALIPGAVAIEVRNGLHETAIADEGQFPSPTGEDLAGCVGPIVRRFIASAGQTGDTSCIARIRPIRTVPAFARSWTAVAPASPAAGDASGRDGLRLASAAAETVGDAVAEFAVSQIGTGAGLRGGTFSIVATATGYQLVLAGLRWTEDLAVDGTVDWNQATGAVSAEVTLDAPGHSGTVHLAWNDRDADALATLDGTVDGHVLAATRLAP